MKRSKFSLSNYKLLTCNLGELVPCGLLEVLPGDTIQHATSALVRATPLLAPVMHPVHVRIHHFFVPFRLIWDDWENFITGGEDGLNNSTFPTYTVNTGTGFAVGSLADYLGVPTGIDDIAVSALPFRAYAAVYNEYYRDQDLQTALTIDTTDGADTTTNVDLQKVNWEKDYFTSARPWAQKGTAVSIPLGTTAKVYTDQTADGQIGVYSTVAGGYRKLAADGAYVDIDTAAASNQASSLHTDLSTATAATINQLREAIQLQRYAENRALYGSRYTEYLRFLGIRPSDARLQRPEYLGGGKQTIQFSEVLQTGVTTSGNDAGPGNLKGHGIGAMRSNRYRRFFEEHGYVLSLLSIKPKTMYAEGLPRTWNRREKEDFFQQELQHIGQQAILNKEIYAAHATPEGTFGYQDRYDEYRRQESTIAGDFRSSDANFWHFARILGAQPTLNSAFITATQITRPFAVTSRDTIQVMANHSIQARRLLHKTGTPGGLF